MASRWDPGQDEIDVFVELVLAGSSVRAAALELGWAFSKAYEIAHSLDLPLRQSKRTSKSAKAEIVRLWKAGVAPMDIVRQVGASSSVVYSIGMKLGLWHRSRLSRRAVATQLRCEYLTLRVNALSRKDAAQAMGINPRAALDFDKGVIKVNGLGRIPFEPSGPDVFLYKRLMQVLEYVDNRVSVPVQIIEQHRIDQRISSRYLSIEEREIIYDLRNKQWGVRAIARHLNRAPSTISKELKRNTDDFDLYLPSHAHRKSVLRRFRPKPRKLDSNLRLREAVWAALKKKHSPRQIAYRLRKTYPGDDTMKVCAETIYQSLFFQAKGELKKEIAACLRRGRTIRKPRGQRIARQRFIDPMVMISQRPAEAADRAVPGHWEGDLILGKNNGSAIGTLVERSTRYVLLLHLPHGHGAIEVRNALVTAIDALPRHLRASLTWDQGSEMAGHKSFSIATDCPVYFCDPGSPWQRGSNENTNGLLRQYFPKSTDLSIHTETDLEYVAMELNNRPRETLDFDTPAERLQQLLDSANK